jgi:alpha-D-ribose 1-methylphosphonate 5-triphosphate synthase subunit PhnG
MVRGRIGGSGDSFNVGEATVTRCTVSLPCGTIGHAYVLGQSDRHAHVAALLDALLQTGSGPGLMENVIEPLAAEQAARRQTKRDKAAATKVDFFTMVRGDD